MELTGPFDAIVIGSGAGGAAAAWRLCSEGLAVLLLEAGPAFDPGTDYPLNAPGWERKGFPEKPGSQTRISYGDLGRLDPEFADLADWSRAGLPWGPRVGDARAPKAGGYSYVMGVGGSTLHFVGEAHRLHPDAFRQQSLTGTGADWPIGYGDLEPYYAVSEAMTGVAGAADDAARWRSTPYPLPPHPLGPGARALTQAGARLGQRWGVNPRAALSEPYRDRPACNYCGQCSRGCPLGDKGSTDVTFLAAAQATGRLTLVADAPVTRLIAGANGRITHLEAVVQGRATRIEAPLVVLAAGAVQTPRLLLLSADADRPEGLANGSGQVGRNFMETLSWQSTGFVPGLVNSHMGLPADAICWAPEGGSGDGGYRLNHTTQEIGLTGPVNYGARLVAGFGAGFKAEMRARFGQALAVGAIGRLVPDDRSRVVLDPEARDALGLPAARISSVLTRESLARLSRMAGSARKILAEAGAEIVSEGGSWGGFSATHVFGTARMGVDSARSVVDPRGRSHDHPNLWIADASVFPSSGDGESPSLTIMSLALRSADAILAG